MRRNWFLWATLAGLLAPGPGPLAARAGQRPEPALAILSPLDFQVIQRTTRERGTIPLRGTFTDLPAPPDAIEARLGPDAPWLRLEARIEGGRFQGPLDAAAGGWSRLEVRAIAGDRVLAAAAVEHVGIGEVFVVAGQSNSANHGEEKQTTRTGRVAAFDGQRWQLAHDPQPGASGDGGSFLPPFGDALAGRFGVPIGLVACGVGATSVREWLPAGARFPNPPTLEGNVRRLPDGGWESTGTLFDAFVARLRPLGPHGFRAVLWHQGESDANQRDPSRTLAGPLYQELLTRLITETGRTLGWEPVWFVAQASYHEPGDEASPEIRAAQAAVAEAGRARPGPDTDTLRGALRDSGGRGVHFSGEGLTQHAALWVAAVGPWLQAQLDRPPTPP